MTTNTLNRIHVSKVKRLATLALNLALLGLLASACGGDDDPPPPHCQGTAIACSARNPTQCLKSAGCSQSGTCGGSATPCSRLTSAGDCSFQEGCFWNLDDIAHSFCEGSASSCSQAAGESTCGLQEGCTWNASCIGKPLRDCGEMLLSECKTVPGCTWKE